MELILGRGNRWDRGRLRWLTIQIALFPNWVSYLAGSGQNCWHRVARSAVAAAETPVRRQTDKSGRAVAEDSSATVAGRYFALDDWALLGTPASRSSGPSHSCLDTEAETSLQFREKGQDLGGVVVVVDLSVV